MRLTLGQIAERTGGTVRGDASLVIEGAAGLADAGPTDVSFLANEKYGPFLKTTRAGAVIVSADQDTGDRPAVVVKNPALAWARVLEELDRERARRPAGVHPAAVVSPSARLGAGVAVGAHAVIEDGAVIGDRTIVYPLAYVGHDVRIGADCLVYPHVTVRERVAIGDRCILQPGVVIGGDGYGFAPAGGRHHKIPQVGSVIIEDDVEIQANTTIDRAAVGATRIGRGTKIDNLVQIAHGVEIGENGLVVAQTGVAGSAKIGKNVTLAAQVGVVGHIDIGDNVVAASRSGISKSVEGNQVLWGSPAQPIREEMKFQAALRRVPAALEELRKLKERTSHP